MSMASSGVVGRVFSLVRKIIRTKIVFVFVGLIIRTTCSGQSVENPLNRDDEAENNDTCTEKAISCDSVDVNPVINRDSLCGVGCCTRAMEEQLQTRSQRDFYESLINLINSTLDIFNSSRSRFDDYFTGMLDQSSIDLHNMFVKTYGLLYQQNSDIFLDLFQNLRHYFKDLGRVNLPKALDEFFSALMQRIFILLNAQHDFDEDYLTCISDNVDEINPFGDVPSKLLRHIKRSFIAAKTFLHGLSVGQNVVRAISKVTFSDSCMRRVARMLRCSTCSGFPCARPCMNYCAAVTSVCLEPLNTDLSENWIIFIDELMKVAEKLEGPFNIENVMDPIEVTISEAIMNFQTNFDTLSIQIFSKCGKPELRAERRKRNLNATETLDHRKARKKQKESQEERKKQQEIRLDQLLRDIRHLVQNTKLFWRQLENLTCDNFSVNGSNSSCWNGTHLVSNGTDSAVFHLDGGRHVPDIDFHSSTIINQQITQLRVLIVKLKMAANGMDLDWINGSDVDMPYESGSGSDSEVDGFDGSGHSEVGHAGHDHNVYRKQTLLSTFTKINTDPPQHDHRSSNSVGFQRLQHSSLGVACLIFYLYIHVYIKR